METFDVIIIGLGAGGGTLVHILAETGKTLYRENHYFVEGNTLNPLKGMSF